VNSAAADGHNHDDVRAIELLVRRYADICDEAYDPDKLVELFTEDAVWEGSSAQGTSDFGVHRGRQQIYDFFAGVSAEIVHAHHIVMSPQVEVIEPGTSATGRWNTIVLMQLANDEHATAEDQAKLMAAVYKHQYRCEDGIWRMSHLHVHTRFDLRLSQIG
jgi:uncharacterized protein (TIGR02246 family)